jgi:dienelactone hydrolase
LPVFQGSFERFNAPAVKGWLQRVRDWRADVGRTLDYLSARKDIQPGKFAFLGVSYGASYPLSLLAFEERLQTAVLLAGGLGNTELPQNADPIHYLPYVTLPVLMVNGRYDDITFPRNQLGLYERLGSAQKVHKVFHAGHGFFPRGEFVQVTLDWFDKYLGSVGP